MEANIATRPTAAVLPPDDFREGITADAIAVLTDILGSEQGAIAGSRVAMAIVALAKANPKIRDASRASVINCVAMCALTGLMPGGALPGVYVIPRAAKGVMELNFQIGYRGLLTLAQRAGVQISAYPVYPGAPVDLDANDRLIIPTERRKVDRNPDNLIGVVVTAHRMDTGMSYGRFFVESDLIEARRAVSDAWQRGQKKGAADWERSSPWYQWPEEMSLKTAVAYVIRRGSVPVDDVAQHVLRADAEGDRPVVIEADVVRPTPLRISEASSTLDSILNEPAERVAVPVTGPHIATLTAAGLAWSEVCEWYAETQGKDPNDWPDTDKAAFAADVAANPANFKASPFYTGGGK